MTGPAGATFGPVLGLMVFAYITARLILFATAWAATAKENLEAAPVEPPDGCGDHSAGAGARGAWTRRRARPRRPWEPLAHWASRGFARRR